MHFDNTLLVVKSSPTLELARASPLFSFVCTVKHNPAPQRRETEARLNFNAVFARTLSVPRPIMIEPQKTL